MLIVLWTFVLVTSYPNIFDQSLDKKVQVFGYMECLLMMQEKILQKVV